MTVCSVGESCRLFYDNGVGQSGLQTVSLLRSPNHYPFLVMAAKQFPELLASLLQRVENTPAIQKALRAAVRENGPQAREAAEAAAETAEGEQ